VIVERVDKLNVLMMLQRERERERERERDLFKLTTGNIFLGNFLV
jgi:hypothetical protein